MWCRTCEYWGGGRERGCVLEHGGLCQCGAGLVSIGGGGRGREREMKMEEWCVLIMGSMPVLSKLVGVYERKEGEGGNEKWGAGSY